MTYTGNLHTAKLLLNVMLFVGWYKPMPLQSLGTKLLMIMESNLGQQVTASAELWEWRTILVRISNKLMTAFGPGRKISRMYLKQSTLTSIKGILNRQEKKKERVQRAVIWVYWSEMWTHYISWFSNISHWQHPARDVLPLTSTPSRLSSDWD
jgi:hypothetical protein